MKSNPYILLFLILVFFSGMYVYATNRLNKYLEPMENQTQNNDGQSSCPTLLIKEGNALILFDPKQPQSDTNPLPFYGLDEYINYLEIQRKKGIFCPVLYLQKENDTQGNDVYRIRPSPTDLQGGLPYTHNMPNNIAQQMKNPLPIVDSNRDNPPYNSGNYPGFDPLGLFVGQYTQLDKIHNSTSLQPVSPNPADTNWGGVQFTQTLVDQGVYNDNNVYPPLLIDASKMR
jgi:hypothetical protein